MRNLLVVVMALLVFFISGCAQTTATKSPKAVIEKALLDSQNFIRIYYIAKTSEYHIYLVRTLGGYVQIISVSKTYPVKVLKTDPLFECDRAGWD